MSERANFQKNYLLRYAALATFCLLLSLWFAYDGLIGYPKKLPMAAAYDEIRDLETEERIARWKQLAADNDWPSSAPEKTAEDIEDDIIGQYFWAAINLAIGLPALVLFLRSRNSWVESTESGLTTSWGQTVDFTAVTQLDKKRWANKGIAKASYQEQGQTKVFVFDDFKFEREPLGKMLRSLEDILEREKIVGGPTELETEEEKAREEAEEEASDVAADDLNDPDSDV